MGTQQVPRSLQVVHESDSSSVTTEGFQPRETDSESGLTCSKLQALMEVGP